MVDVATTKIGTNLKGEELIGVPNSTDVWGALSEAPGVRMQGFDVGGSHKSQQSGYEVFGVQNQARVVTDGIDHTEGVGGTGFYEDYFANEEVSVSALGGDVEMNSPRRGHRHDDQERRQRVQGARASQLRAGQLRRQQRRAGRRQRARLQVPAECVRDAAVREPEPAVLGRRTPISAARSSGTRSGSTPPTTTSRSTRSSPASTSRSPPTSASSTTTPAKVTGKVSQNNTLIGYIQRGRKQKPQRGLSTLRPPESIQAQDSWSTMYKGEWQWVVSSRAFLNVNVGSFRLAWPMVPAVDPAVSRPALDSVDDGACAAPAGTASRPSATSRR